MLIVNEMTRYTQETGKGNQERDEDSNLEILAERKGEGKDNEEIE